MTTRLLEDLEGDLVDAHLAGEDLLAEEVHQASARLGHLDGPGSHRASAQFHAHAVEGRAVRKLASQDEGEETRTRNALRDELLGCSGNEHGGHRSVRVPATAGGSVTSKLSSQCVQGNRLQRES